MPRLIVLALTVAFLFAAPSSVVTASPDWPRWLGPDQDGSSTGFASLAGPDGKVGLTVAWSHPLGIAYSGIAVVKGRAVTMFADGESDWVTAVDVETGREIWRYRIDSMFPSTGGSEGGPAGMPVVHDGVVYGLGTKGHLFALGLDDGKEVWAVRIDEALGARAPGFGFATVPLVAGDVLFVQVGGDEGRSLVGFDRHTGEVLWSTGDDKVGYQSPVLVSLAGREQIVAVTNVAVVGLDPVSGTILWSHEHGVSDGEDGYCTPVLLGDDGFVLTGQQLSRAFRVQPAGDGFEVEQLWETTALKGSLATPVVHDGHVYGFDNAFLTCVDAANGEKVWKSRPPGGNGLINVDGHLVVFANDGSVVVAEASPEGYEETARVQVSETGSYTYPSFADGLILVRNTRDIAAVAVGPAVEGKASSSVASLSPPRNAFDRFVRKVAGARDKRLLVDDFMASCESFPVVEDGRWVHFLYRGDAEDVAITGTMTEFQVEEPLERIEGTDLYWRSYEIEPGARWEYRLNVDFENLQPDPLNPRRVPGDQGDLSEVVTPGWQPPDFLRPYDGDERGRVESLTLPSEILESERVVDVYLPAGYDAGGDRRYPLVLFADGKDWLDKANLPNTLDHLVGMRIAPVVAAFVEVPPSAARDELGGSKAADHVRMLAEELLPMLEAKYRLQPGPGSRVIVGVGSGALLAAYAAVERPELFGQVVAQSVFLGQPVGKEIMETIEDGEAKGPTKPDFHVGWNRYELRRADWGVDLGRDSERLADALEAAGYAVESREALDSFGWGGWRVRAGEILETIFPM